LSLIWPITCLVRRQTLLNQPTNVPHLKYFFTVMEKARDHWQGAKPECTVSPLPILCFNHRVQAECQPTVHADLVPHRDSLRSPHTPPCDGRLPGDSRLRPIRSECSLCPDAATMATDRAGGGWLRAGKRRRVTADSRGDAVKTWTCFRCAVGKAITVLIHTKRSSGDHVTSASRPTTAIIHSVQQQRLKPCSVHRFEGSTINPIRVSYAESLKKSLAFTKRPCDCCVVSFGPNFR